MKKADFVVILIIGIISITFYGIYLSSLQIDNNNYIEITYKNIPLYTVRLQEDTEITVEISSDNNLISVKTEDKTSEFNIKTDKEIYNVISISYKETKMIDANCEDNSVHAGMIITKSMPMPIVCFNGINVRMIGLIDEYVIIL